MADRTRDDKGVFLPSHGLSKTRLYNVWCAMKERCNNPHNKSYQRYGARGITITPEWQNSFETFYAWAVENGYTDGLTIDRIDNNRGYSPDNCRWVTAAQQNRNYSRNHLIAYNGKTQCIADWETETGIKRSTILWRLQAGKTLEQVFNRNDGRYANGKEFVFNAVRH